MPGVSRSGELEAEAPPVPPSPVPAAVEGLWLPVAAAQRDPAASPTVPERGAGGRPAVGGRVGGELPGSTGALWTLVDAPRGPSGSGRKETRVKKREVSGG